jgi:hypothetical protein
MANKERPKRRSGSVGSTPPGRTDNMVISRPANAIEVSLMEGEDMGESGGKVMMKNGSRNEPPSLRAPVLRVSGLPDAKRLVVEVRHEKFISRKCLNFPAWHNCLGSHPEQQKLKIKEVETR